MIHFASHFNAGPKNLVGPKPFQFVLTRGEVFTISPLHLQIERPNREMRDTMKNEIYVWGFPRVFICSRACTKCWPLMMNYYESKVTVDVSEELFRNPHDFLVADFLFCRKLQQTPLNAVQFASSTAL
jgi:hypothetical protein